MFAKTDSIRAVLSRFPCRNVTSDTNYEKEIFHVKSFVQAQGMPNLAQPYSVWSKDFKYVAVNTP